MCGLAAKVDRSNPRKANDFKRNPLCEKTALLMNYAGKNMKI
jgi:hypothetical protein